MSDSNGEKFAQFQGYSTDKKLDYLYLEIQNQKNDLKWWATIFSAIISAVFYFGRFLIGKMFGDSTG